MRGGGDLAENVILKLKNINKKYNDFKLNNININLETSKVTGFIGQNGAGKTTTMKIIMGLIKADSGEIEYLGNRKQEYESNLNNISFLRCNQEIYPNFKIRELTQFHRKAYNKIWNEVSYQNYMYEFELNENMKIKDLSSGMKAKYYIALELSKRTEILIFDEPTSGLDPIVRRSLLRILKEICTKEKRTILFSSHITEDIDKISDNIIFIDDGNIILSTSRESIKKRYKIISKLNFNHYKHIFKEFVEDFEDYIVDTGDLNNKETGVEFQEAKIEQVLYYLKMKKREMKK